MPELAKTPIHRQDLADQMQILQRNYIFVGGLDAVTDFLAEEPPTFSLMNEAVEPLKNAFGKNRVITARVQNSGDDKLLKVAVLLPSDLDGVVPEQALECFDSAWWLNNCHRSRGGLVFDYEIQDAV